MYTKYFFDHNVLLISKWTERKALYTLGLAFWNTFQEVIFCEQNLHENYLAQIKSVSGWPAKTLISFIFSYIWDPNYKCLPLNSYPEHCSRTLLFWSSVGLFVWIFYIFWYGHQSATLSTIFCDPFFFLLQVANFPSSVSFVSFFPIALFLIS